MKKKNLIILGISLISILTAGCSSSEYKPKKNPLEENRYNSEKDNQIYLNNIKQKKIIEEMERDTIQAKYPTAK